MSENIGYDDTPILPGTPWHVHDGKRPQPPVVAPGTPSTQDASGEPPSDAVVLFDGTDLSKWESKNTGGPAEWKVENGYMEVVPGTGYIRTKEEFGDCHLHVEWRAPEEISGESQGRGNSGVFLMGLYEIQVLDSYENPTYPDGTAGAIYGQYPPLANACRPPGQWQVYDIIWEGPRFDGDEVIRPARVTVILNGVVLHHAQELRGVTSHKVVTEYEPHGEVGPLELQDHRDLVRFRNIWYRPLTDYDEG
ncbi:MAG: 3-keto-disaccharide hydrolase [Armatimonadota bacterium]|jgi:hypothetical protein